MIASSASGAQTLYSSCGGVIMACMAHPTPAHPSMGSIGKSVAWLGMSWGPLTMSPTNGCSQPCSVGAPRRRPPSTDQGQSG